MLMRGLPYKRVDLVAHGRELRALPLDPGLGRAVEAGDGGKCGWTVGVRLARPRDLVLAARPLGVLAFGIPSTRIFGARRSGRKSGGTIDRVGEGTEPFTTRRAHL